MKLNNKLLKDQAQAIENLRKTDVANTVTDAVHKINQEVIEPKIAEITANTSRIDSLQKDVDELKRQLQGVVGPSATVKRNRRSLATTPGISDDEMKSLLESKVSTEPKKEEKA
jgi:hypothetical protein